MWGRVAGIERLDRHSEVDFHMACARRWCDGRPSDQGYMTARFEGNRQRDGFSLRRLGVERDAVPVCAPGTLSCPSAFG